MKYLISAQLVELELVSPFFQTKVDRKYLLRRHTLNTSVLTGESITIANFLWHITRMLLKLKKGTFTKLTIYEESVLYTYFVQFLNVGAEAFIEETHFWQVN